jgi:PAS domain S-box-containing protein
MREKTLASDTGIWAAGAGASAAALLICDADGVIVQANRGTLDLFGLEASDIAGRRLTELCAHKPDLESTSQTFEHEGQTLQSVTLQDAGVSREAAEHLAVKLKVEALGELAGNIAHEFNNHLGGASGFAQMAMIKLDDPERVRMCLEEVIAATDAGAEQTARIMVFGRRQLFEPEPTTVGRHVTDSRGLVESLITPDIELSMVVEDEVSKCLLTPGQLAEAILELCENAVNAMAATDGGRLEIRLVRRDLTETDLRTFYDAAPGPYLCLSVSDTGTGMTADTRQRMFDPLYSTQDIGEGNGLGMALVYSVFARSGGMLDVKSKPGEGTTVTALLPVIG